MYSGLGSNHPSRPRPSSTNSMTPAQAEKARQLEENSAAWRRLTELHRITFPEATHPGAVTADPVPMFPALLAGAEKRHLVGVGRLDRETRRRAREAARVEAESEAVGLLETGLRTWSERQDASDLAWSALMKGDSDAVAGAVSGALSGRGVPADVTSDRTGHVRLELRTSLEGEDIPTHQPSVTAKGTPTLKKLTKTETAHHVRHVLAARVLLAAKEAFAQSPAIAEVDVVATRGADSLLRTHLTRAAMSRAPWQMAAWHVLEVVDPMMEANIGGRTQELRPLK